MDIIKSHDRTRSPSYGAIISDFFEKFVKRNYNSGQHYNFSLNYPEVILYNKFIIYRIKPPGTKDSLYPPVVTVFSYYHLCFIYIFAREMLEFLTKMLF